jgi:magnesium transporter
MNDITEAVAVRDEAILFDAAAMAARLIEESAPDIADALDALEPEEAAAVLALLPPERAVEALDQPSLDHAHDLLVLLPREQAAPLLAAMSADRAADVLKEMEEEVRADLLGRLDRENRATLDRLLAYPEDTAGSIMTTEFVSVPSTWTIAEVLHHIRMVERTRETVYAVFVTDPVRQTLLHAVPLRRLISGDPHANVLTAAPARKLVSVSARAPREEAIRLISRYDLLAVPVVDARGHLIGIVTVDDVIDAMVKRDTEQVQRMGGMAAVDEPYLEAGFWHMIRKRGGWLSILLLGEMMTATAMQGFQGELEKAIVLSLFIPLIMSSGGNSGSQAASLLIRALALQEVKIADWWRVAIRELPSGITLGAILGLIAFARVAAWQYFGLYDHGPHWLLIGLTVAAALVAIVTFGSMCGSMLPFLLQRVGFDPATASAPFVATLVDVTGLVIYFSVALVVLRGTLL